MGNSTYTKNDDSLDINYVFTEDDKEQDPPSPYIEKNNDTTGGIIKNPDVIVEITNNFSNAETKATSQILKKKRNINNNNNKKYSTDNLPRKIKTIAFELIFKFCNKKIEEIYNNNILNGINIKTLKKISYNQIKKMSADYNKILLNKKIKEIFSVDISKKYTDFPPSHNKNLINLLLNEEDKEKKIQFNNLFNKTFKECLEQIRGDKNHEGLEGLEEAYIEYKNKEIISLEENDNSREYRNKFEEMLKNYEESFFNKKQKKKI